jgi:hypothetical protein
LILLWVAVACGFVPLHLQAQDLPPDQVQTSDPTPGTSAKPEDARPAQVRANNAKELLDQLNAEDKKNRDRIKEIEAILFPYEDKIAVELFFFTPGEYGFLRRQTEGARSATQFFEAQSRIDRSSWDGVSFFFDLAYDSLRAGYLWVGREQALITEDTKLYNDIRSKVQEEMRKRPDGEAILKLSAERDALLSKAKTSEPLLKYFNERRQWWKSYPDYESTLTETVP